MKDSYQREIDYLRISLTDLCNLRCRYCMPEEGVEKKRHCEMLTEDEIIAAVRAAASLGVTKVRVTGGEPLVKKNLLSICSRIAAVPGVRTLCITTNGTLLSELAVPLRDAGVSRINISLDTLQPDKYRHITRCGSFADAWRGVEAALAAGFEKVKLNTVLIGGFNDDEIGALAALTQRYPLDVRFIELMPMNGNREFGPQAFLPCAKVLEALPDAAPAAQDGGVARLYRLPGAKGSIGLISPLSSHFCAACNRLRLTADGKLKPCLHSSEEYTVKGLPYETVCAQMRTAILQKPQWHGTLSPEARSRTARNMNEIGG